MKWFGRKAVREAARPFLLRGLWGQAGEPLPRSYEAQVRAAYLGNAVAQRAVRLVAETLASIAVEASGREGDGGLEQAVSLIDPPLLESIATQLLLHGNAFVHVAQNGEGQPARLFPLRPERVKVEPDGTGPTPSCGGGR